MALVFIVSSLWFCIQKYMYYATLYNTFMTPLKEFLNGTNFPSDDEVKSTVSKWLKSLSKNIYTSSLLTKNVLSAQWVECLLMLRETWVQSQVASYQRLKKWYLIPLCLTLGNIRYISRVKWSNPWKGVAPSPTPRCSSYWKRSLLVALDCQVLLLLILSKNKAKIYMRVI